MPQDQPTVSYAIHRFLLERRVYLREKSYESYEYSLRNFPSWGLSQNPPIHHLGDVHYKHIPLYLWDLQQEGKSHNTVHRAARAIKTFLMWCTVDEELEKYVMDERYVRKIRMPRVHQEPIQIFSKENIQKLLQAARHHENPIRAARNEAIILLLLDTGARASEVAYDSERPQERTGLRLGDLKFKQHPYIEIVGGKGGKPRTVGVGERTRKAINLYKNHYRSDTKHDYLFLGLWSGPLTVRGLEQVIKDIGEAAGIEGIRCSPHTFRHTWAVHWLKKHKDVHGLSRLMGHTSIKVTERYLAYVDLEELRQRSSVVDDLD